MWEFKFLQILYPQDTFAWALWFNHMQFGTLCLNAIKLKGLHMLCVLQYFCSNFSQRYFSTNHQSLISYYFIPFHAKKCIGKPIVLFVLFLFSRPLILISHVFCPENLIYSEIFGVFIRIFGINNHGRTLDRMYSW